MPPLAARLLAFVALAAFGAQAWGRMVRPEAGGRQLLVVLVAAAVGGALVALRPLAPGPARRAGLLATGSSRSPPRCCSPASRSRCWTTTTGACSPTAWPAASRPSPV
jgi:hypothetical protein